MTEPDLRAAAMAGAFEEQRERLVAVAYRMLGSRADAEDAVQEAWLRLARQDAAAIDNLAGWLTTVVGRVCIDMLRSRRARPEASYDDRLPELVVTVDDGAAPEDDALLADSVGLALLVVLDTLRPTERLAFVLHDMFAVPFEEIGQIIGRSTDATKMLASRARRKVQGTPQPDGRAAAAARGGRRVPRRGAGRRLRRAAAGARPGRDLAQPTPHVAWSSSSERPRWPRRPSAGVRPDGSRCDRCSSTASPGSCSGTRRAGRGVMACTVVDGRIVDMLSVIDPKRLAEMDLPGPLLET